MFVFVFLFVVIVVFVCEKWGLSDNTQPLVQLDMVPVLQFADTVNYVYSYILLWKFFSIKVIILWICCKPVFVVLL